MMTEMLPLLIALIALIIAAGTAIYFWKKSTSLYSLLVEGANRFEELRNQSQSQSEILAKARAELASKDQDYRDSELQVASMSQNQTNWQQQLEAKENELNYIRRKLELQRDHVEKEWRQAEADRDAAREDLLTIKQRASKASKDLLNRETGARKKAEKATVQSHHELIKVTKERDELRRKFGKLTVQDIVRLRRKATQYEKLYNSMRGLRELAEERATNWETGARKLAIYTLAQQQKLSPALEQGPVGPLVTTALSLIGVQLIDDDDFSTSPSNNTQDPIEEQPPSRQQPTKQIDQSFQSVKNSAL